MGKFFAKCTLTVSLYISLFISALVANESALYHRDEYFIYLILGSVFLYFAVPASILLYVFGFLFDKKFIGFFTQKRLKVIGFFLFVLVLTSAPTIRNQYYLFKYNEI